ncbi:unnamed protein product [Orchesella dallaii]|uniref:Transmembrane protein n=1 Tax=Orchesella dallaii TaxID=48710 RepID=A0ABP1RM85_9HEXA
MNVSSQLFGLERWNTESVAAPNPTVVDVFLRTKLYVKWNRKLKTRVLSLCNFSSRVGFGLVSSLFVSFIYVFYSVIIIQFTVTFPMLAITSHRSSSRGSL